MNPWIIIGLMISLSGAYGIGRHNGYALKELEDAAEISRINTQMNADKEKADAQLEQTKKQLATKQSQLFDAIHSGNQRLYVTIRSNNPNPTTSSGNSAQRAELDPTTSEALVGITGQGDSAIVLLNSCIDRFNQVREAVRGKR